MKLNVGRILALSLIILTGITVMFSSSVLRAAKTTNALQCEKDRDCDGVRNNKDNCPDEAGPVENGGCPIIKVTPIPPTQERHLDVSTATPIPPTPVPPTRVPPTLTPTPDVLTDCPEYEGDFDTLNPDIKDYIFEHPDKACGMMDTDAIDVIEIHADRVNKDCPEKLPWYLHNQYRLKSRTGLTANLNSLNPADCGETDYGEGDLQEIQSCLAGENITKAVAGTILNQLDDFALTPLKEHNEVCKIVRAVQSIGSPTEPQKAFYFWLPDFCGGYTEIDRLNYVYLGIIYGANLTEIMDSLNSDLQGRHVAEGQTCPDLSPVLQDPDHGLPDAPVSVPELQMCDIAIQQLYQNHLSSLSSYDQKQLLCQVDTCQAVRNYIRTGFIPASCPVISSDNPAATDTPIDITPEVAPPFDDTMIDAVLSADNGNSPSNIYGVNYRPQAAPEVWQITTNSSEDKMYPQLNLDNSQMVYLKVNTENPPELWLVEFDQRPSDQQEHDTRHVKDEYSVGRSDFTPVAGALAWDAANNIMVQLTSPDGKTGIYMYTHNDLLTHNRKPKLLILNGANPAVTKSEVNGEFIAYEDHTTGLLRWSELRNVTGNQHLDQGFTGAGIPDSANCRTPVFGRHSLFIFFICRGSSAEEDRIMRYDISEEQVDLPPVQIWPNEKTAVEDRQLLSQGAVITNLDSAIAGDILSFTLQTPSGETPFFIYDANSQIRLESDLLRNLDPFKQWDHYRLLSFAWVLSLD